MKILFSTALLNFTLFFSVAAIAEFEDRGAHCQPPSCFGSRFGNLCIGKWVCAMQHVRWDRPELEPQYICIHWNRENTDAICCKNGKEVLNCTRNNKGELIINIKEEAEDK